MAFYGGHVRWWLLSVVSLSIWWSAAGAFVRSERKAQQHPTEQELLNLIKELKQEGMQDREGALQDSRVGSEEKENNKLSALENVLSKLEQGQGQQHQDEAVSREKLADVTRHMQPAEHSVRELTVPEDSYIRLAPQSNSLGEQRAEDGAIYISAKSPLKLTLLSRLANSQMEGKTSQHVNSLNRLVRCIVYDPC